VFPVRLSSLAKGIRFAIHSMLYGIERIAVAEEIAVRELARGAYIVIREGTARARILCYGKPHRIVITGIRIAILDRDGRKLRELSIEYPGIPSRARMAGEHVEIDLRDQQAVGIDHSGGGS
jgi:hypothetical protein